MHTISPATQSPERPQTVVVLGDSLTEQGGYLANGSNPTLKATSYWTHANTLLGWRFKIIRNSGIFGQTTTQILSRIEQDAISYKPGWVWLMAGTNDVGQGIIQSTTIPNLSRILDRLEQANIRVLWCTIPPRIGSKYSGTMLTDTVMLNEWIRAEARRRANVVLADIWEPLANDGSAGNYAGTVYGHNPTSDGIHMSGCGGFAAGQIVYNALNGITATRDPFSFLADHTGINLVSDPRFATGTGTSAPTGWVVNNFPTGGAWSKTQRTDQVGSWQTLTVPNGTTVPVSLQSNLYADRSGRGSAQMIGRTVVGTVEFQVSGLDQAAADSAQGLYISVGFYNGSSFTHSYGMQDNSGPNASRSGRLVTAPVVVPAGTTTISLFIWAIGGGTYNFDKAGLYDVDQVDVGAF